MLNGKTYAPGSYVGSPRFTRMEKTAHTMFSDGDKYPTTKEVRLLLTLRLVSVVVTSFRLSILPFLGRRTRKRTSITSLRRGCRWTTWYIMGAWSLSIGTSWIVAPMTCLLTIQRSTILSMSGREIWTPWISHGTLQRVPCTTWLVWGTVSGP